MYEITIKANNKNGQITQTTQDTLHCLTPYKILYRLPITLAISTPKNKTRDLKNDLKKISCLLYKYAWISKTNAKN